MKAIRCLEEMKRVGLISKDMTLRDLKRYKLIFHESSTPWIDVVKGIGLARYFSDDWPLPEEGIVIFEMQFGGTMRMEMVGRNGETSSKRCHLALGCLERRTGKCVGEMSYRSPCIEVDYGKVD